MSISHSQTNHGYRRHCYVIVVSVPSASAHDDKKKYESKIRQQQQQQKCGKTTEKGLFVQNACISNVTARVYMCS